MWGSFEIRNQRLASTMLQQYAMEPLKENLHKFETWANNFEKLPIYFLKFHGQQSIELVMEVCFASLQKFNLQHVLSKFFCPYRLLNKPPTFMISVI